MKYIINLIIITLPSKINHHLEARTSTQPALSTHTLAALEKACKRERSARILGHSMTGSAAYLGNSSTTAPATDTAVRPNQIGYQTGSGKGCEGGANRSEGAIRRRVVATIVRLAGPAGPAQPVRHEPRYRPEMRC